MLYYVGRQVVEKVYVVECFLMSSPSLLGQLAAAVLAQRPVEYL